HRPEPGSGRRGPTGPCGLSSTGPRPPPSGRLAPHPRGWHGSRRAPPAGRTESPQGERGVEAHDVYLALEGIDERIDLRGCLRAGAQQSPQGLGPDAVVSVVEGCFLQGGPEHGEHTADVPGEVAEGRDCPEADVTIGVLQQRQEAWYRRQWGRSAAPSHTGLRPFKGAVMAEGSEPIREGRLLAGAHGPNLSLDKFFRHRIPPRASNCSAPGDPLGEGDTPPLLLRCCPIPKRDPNGGTGAPKQTRQRWMRKATGVPGKGNQGFLWSLGREECLEGDSRTAGEAG